MPDEHMHIGFAGGDVGLTRAQRRSLSQELDKQRGFFHHGDRIGADEQAHNLAGMHNYKIIMHPGDKREQRAFCMGPPGCRAGEMPRTAAWASMLEKCELVIIAPKDEEENPGLSEWTVYRLANKAGIEIIVIYPDGSCVSQ